MRKICVITGTRAEYGLLRNVIKEIDKAPELQLQLCVTGMHLSAEFGLTYREIEEDGFVIDEKLEILLSSDTAVGVAKGIGLGVIAFAEAFARLQPDMVLLLGDRFEIFAAATAAQVSRIPVAHCNGGETTEGAIDEAFRHSITKMAHLHFTAAEEYRARVIQLGEAPERVFKVGHLSTENIFRAPLLSKSAFEEAINFRLREVNFLVTFHPVTLEKASAGKQFEHVLEALGHFPQAGIIFTKPNADTDGRVLISMIDEFVGQNAERTISFTSLGHHRYLSALQFVDAVIGNSSSGLTEVPVFRKPTVNIGDRQKGRIKPPSVIDCAPEVTSIVPALKMALSADFKKILANMPEPFPGNNTAEQIISVLKSAELSDKLKKQFYNLP